MRIIYCGSSPFGLHCLEVMKDSDDQIVHIFTQPAHRAGRGRHVRHTAVAQWAMQNNIPYTETENVNTPDMIELIRSLKPDLMVVIAFGQKICNELIDLPKYSAINVHGSVLPKYRGAAPINWAIVNGDKEAGITIIKLAERMDAGEMLGISKCPLEYDDDFQTLHDKLALISAPALEKVIDELKDGSAIFEVQDNNEATIARKLKKSDGFIKWSNPAEKVHDMIRGFWPWPGAQTDYLHKISGKCHRVTIAQTEVVDLSTTKDFVAPGILDDELNVACGSRAIKILRLKPSGKGLMDFKDFINGRQCQPGDMFMELEN